MLRAHVGEPLLDIVRRIIETTGVDVELASAVTPAAAARRDNLDLFVRAVADFQAVDGDVTLLALLAYLTAEDEESKGLEVVAPSAADSVKLLTVHRAKGLEWGAVFLAGVCVGRFPLDRSRTLWTSSPAVLPAPLRGDAADLPQLARLRQGGARAYRDDTRAHEARGGAAARATSRSPAPRTGSRSRRSAGARGRRRSARRRTRQLVREQLEEWGETVDDWLDAPVEGRPQPVRRRGPVEAVAAHRHRRGGAARGSTRPRLVRAADPTAEDDALDMVESARGRRLGRRARAAARRGAGRAQRRDRGAAARQPVGDRAAPPAGRPGRVRPRAGPADAAPAAAAPHGSAPCSTPGSRTASSSSPSSTPTTCPAAPTSTSPTRPTSTTVIAAFETGPVRRPGPARRRGAVRAGPRPARWSAAGSTRSTTSRRRWHGSSLVDWKTNRQRGRRPAPAGPLPAGLGRAARRTARAGARRVPLRAHRQDRRARRTCRTVRRWRPCSRLNVERSSHAATPRAATRPARLAPMVLADGP